MRILVVGATGPTGLALVARALDAGHDVTAFVRDPSAVGRRSARLRVVVGDVLVGGTIARAVAGQDAVVCLLGTASRRPTTLHSVGTRRLVDAMRSAGVERLICQTSVEVGDSRGRGGILFGKVILPLWLRDVFDDKDRQEEVVRSSGLAWTLVRPTGLTASRALGLSRVRVALHGERVPLRIARADVAAFHLAALEAGRFVGQAPVIGTHGSTVL